MLQPLAVFVVWSAVLPDAAAVEQVRAFLQDKEQQLFSVPYTELMFSPTPSLDKITFCCSLGVLQRPGGN